MPRAPTTPHFSYCKPSPSYLCSSRVWRDILVMAGISVCKISAAVRHFIPVRGVNVRFEWLLSSLHVPIKKPKQTGWKGTPDFRWHTYPWNASSTPWAQSWVLSSSSCIFCHWVAVTESHIQDTRTPQQHWLKPTPSSLLRNGTAGLRDCIQPSIQSHLKANSDSGARLGTVSTNPGCSSPHPLDTPQQEETARCHRGRIHVVSLRGKLLSAKETYGPHNHVHPGVCTEVCALLSALFSLHSSTVCLEVWRAITAVTTEWCWLLPVTLNKMGG